MKNRFERALAGSQYSRQTPNKTLTLATKTRWRPRGASRFIASLAAPPRAPAALAQRTAPWPPWPHDSTRRHGAWTRTYCCLPMRRSQMPRERGALPLRLIRDVVDVVSVALVVAVLRPPAGERGRRRAARCVARDLDGYGRAPRGWGRLLLLAARLLPRDLPPTGAAVGATDDMANAAQTAHARRRASSVLSL